MCRWQKAQRGVWRGPSVLRSPQFVPNSGGFAAHAGKAMYSCLTKDCMNSWESVAGR